MSAKNRASLIDKLFKVAKKHYSFNAPPSSRSVLEHMLYACCLQNSTPEAADEALAKLQENFCDWNEVRVTTAEELAEVGKGLRDPLAAANRVKRALFGVFEEYFKFDIDDLKKENLSKAVTAFEGFSGVPPFVVSYTAQNGLGGHSIPLDESMVNLFYVLGILSENEANAETPRVPGLERAIPKTKGVEFFNVVHPLAVAFYSTPFSKNVRDILLKINPGSKERFPKRGGTKKAAEKETVEKKTVAKKKEPASAAPAKKKATKAAPKKKATKSTKKKAPAATKKKTAKKKVTKKKATKKVAKKKTATKKPTKKKSPNKKLSKKKPR